MKKAFTALVLVNLALAACLCVLSQRPDSDSLEVAQADRFAEGEVPGSETNASPLREIRSIGEQSAPAEFSPATPPYSGRGQLKEQPILMPLVFQNVDLSQLNLNPDQLQAIDDLRQRFLSEIDGLQQDPSDPDYRERWKRSQPGIDNDLRGMIGIAAFENYQIQAAVP